MVAAYTRGRAWLADIRSWAFSRWIVCGKYESHSLLRFWWRVWMWFAANLYWRIYPKVDGRTRRGLVGAHEGHAIEAACVLFIESLKCFINVRLTLEDVLHGKADGDYNHSFGRMLVHTDLHTPRQTGHVCWAHETQSLVFSIRYNSRRSDAIAGQKCVSDLTEYGRA